MDIIKLEIHPEYVYLQMQVDPQTGVHKVIKQIKSRTSRILREEFPTLKTKLPTLWTNNYFISTENKLQNEIVDDYIKTQKTSQRQ